MSRFLHSPHASIHYILYMYARTYIIKNFHKELDCAQVKRCPSLYKVIHYPIYSKTAVIGFRISGSDCGSADLFLTEKLNRSSEKI